jgi:UDP-N-acetylglucosamine 2-epimerase (non-hydrolysing)
MEAVNTGCAILVGTEYAAICGVASRLLDNPSQRAAMVAAGNPFGDGKAAQRAAESIAWLLGRHDSAPAQFSTTTSMAALAM